MGPNTRHTFELFLISALAVVIYFISGWLDLLEVFVDFSHGHERWNLDELLVVTFYLAVALAWYAARRKREAVQANRKLFLKNQELKQAVNRIRELEEIIPICAWCKQIRDDEGYWHQLESYMHHHAGTTFSHGICPECENAWRKEAGLQLKPPESPPSSTDAERAEGKKSGRSEGGLDDLD